LLAKHDVGLRKNFDDQTMVFPWFHWVKTKRKAGEKKKKKGKKEGFWESLQAFL